MTLTIFWTKWMSMRLQNLGAEFDDIIKDYFSRLEKSGDDFPTRAAVIEFEDALVKRALELTAWSVTHAAAALNMNRTTLRERLAKNSKTGKRKVGAKHFGRIVYYCRDCGERVRRRNTKRCGSFRCLGRGCRNSRFEEERMVGIPEWVREGEG